MPNKCRTDEMLVNGQCVKACIGENGIVPCSPKPPTKENPGQSLFHHKTMIDLHLERTPTDAGYGDPAWFIASYGTPIPQGIINMIGRGKYQYQEGEFGEGWQAYAGEGTGFPDLTLSNIDRVMNKLGYTRTKDERRTQKYGGGRVGRKHLKTFYGPIWRIEYTSSG